MQNPLLNAVSDGSFIPAIVVYADLGFWYHTHGTECSGYDPTLDLWMWDDVQRRDCPLTNLFEVLVGLWISLDIDGRWPHFMRFLPRPGTARRDLDQPWVLPRGDRRALDP